MPKEMLNVKVSTLETEFDMKLKSGATGKHLFDTIVTTTGIREVSGKFESYLDLSSIGKVVYMYVRRCGKQDVAKKYIF